MLLLDMAYRLLREFRQAFTRLDTPPFTNRRHPGSDIALARVRELHTIQVVILTFWHVSQITGKYYGLTVRGRVSMVGMFIDLDSAWTEQHMAGNTSRPDESIIRPEALSQVLVKLSVKPLEENDAERDDPRSHRPLALNVMAHRRHDAILVSARRGDGKTTFLTDILRLIEGGRKEYLRHLPEDTKESNVSNLYSLGIVDPTLIESKQNIVVIVIEKIKVAVDRAHRLNGAEERGKYEDFKRILHELAAGLTLLDGIGDSALYGKDWADADYVLERGLDKARSAGAFERSFHRYVKKASEFLQMDAFVLAIDDVDTSFDRGWPVLEALRKYFATPRLRIIMAGDLRLYTLLVRQQQWKQIGKDFLEIEYKVFEQKSFINQLINMVDVLQDQYMVKIVRPDNRVELPSLLHLADQKQISFQASRSGPPLEISEQDVTDRFARHLLVIGAFDDRFLIRAALLRLPLRSGLQVIAGAWDVVKNPAQPSEQDRKRAIDVLGQVASASLMSLDLDEYELDDSRSGRVLAVLIQWLTRKELWLSMSRFHPGGVDETKDLVSVRLAARLVQLFRGETRAMFDFWIRLCVIRGKLDRSEIASLQEGVAGGSSKEPNRADIRALLLHLNADRTEPLTQFVCRLAAWDAGRGRQLERRIRLSGASVPSTNRLREIEAASFELYGIRWKDFKRDVFRGVAEGSNSKNKKDLLAALPAPLRGYHERLMNAGWSYTSKRGKEAGFIAKLANTLASLREGIDGPASSAAMLPAFGIVSGQGSENGGYSVLRLIATLAEALDIKQSPLEEDPTKSFKKRIQILAQFRSFPTPGFLGVYDENENAEPEDEEPPVSEKKPEDDGGKPDHLSSMLSVWSKASQLGGQTVAVAPITLTRIWTRFAYAFDDIVAALRHTKTRYLGVLMHRSITAFLHAVGVEALRAAGRTPRKKAIDNPITSSFAFLQLLEDVKDATDVKTGVHQDPNLCFFQLILSCPLWGFFLARTGQDISDEKDRADATEEVFNQYRDAVLNVPNQKMNYEVEFLQAGKKAKFEGLYFLLNSVQLQGFTQSVKGPANGGLTLNTALVGLEKDLQRSKIGQASPTSESTE